MRMKAPGVAVLGVGVEGDRLVERQVAHADLVQGQRLCGQVLERVDVDLVLGLGDGRRGLLRADLDPVRAAREHRVVAHPDDGRLELVGHTRRGIGAREHVAAAGVDLVFERDGHGLTGDRARKVPAHGDHAGDAAFARRREDPHLVTGGDRAAHDRACEAAEVQVRAVDPLHRQPERRMRHVVLDRNSLEVTHQRRPVIPGHLRASILDVVAAQPGHRDRHRLGQIDLPREVAVFVDDGLEDLARAVDEVHLVHGQHDVPDSEQGDDVAVPARLRQHALARVDQDHGEIGGRGAGHHVARVLLVPRRVRNDELALVGGEEPVGDVDRDALLALCRQPVDEQREIERAALGADLLRVRLERGELVLEDHLRVVEQPADQRRLAVIDAAAGDEPQQALVLVGIEVGLDVRADQVRDVRHQK